MLSPLNVAEQHPAEDRLEVLEVQFLDIYAARREVRILCFLPNLCRYAEQLRPLRLVNSVIAPF